MKFTIEGGRPLEGRIVASGAKNAATKLMIASLLTGDECILDNFPSIGDTEITAELCKTVGSMLSVKNSQLRIQTPEIKNSRVTTLSRRNRVPILALGPLLARVGEAEVPTVGGDKIGPRPINLHIKALRALGAEIEMNGNDTIRAKAKHGLRGAVIHFDFPSVGATENAMLAAVLAKGKTILTNIALEPEIISLLKMLQKMGAIMELGGNRDMYIEGVPSLRGVRHRVMPDRNEVVSFACLAVATNGRIYVEDAVQGELITFLNVLRRIGADYTVKFDGIEFWRKGPLVAASVRTAPHPGFMTDWQQPLAVLLTQARGTSTIHETIYEDRFAYTADLIELGANIKIFRTCVRGETCRFSKYKFAHRAVITGPTILHGGQLRVRDLRAGMVNIIAALVSRGKTDIEGIEEIDRGYEKIDERLRSLGARIVREP